MDRHGVLSKEPLGISVGSYHCPPIPVGYRVQNVLRLRKPIFFVLSQKPSQSARPPHSPEHVTGMFLITVKRILDKNVPRLHGQPWRDPVGVFCIVNQIIKGWAICRKPQNTIIDFMRGKAAVEMAIVSFEWLDAICIRVGPDHVLSLRQHTIPELIGMNSRAAGSGMCYDIVIRQNFACVSLFCAFGDIWNNAICVQTHMLTDIEKRLDAQLL
jgi:hypothetical protein